jgi:hypothetical protein
MTVTLFVGDCTEEVSTHAKNLDKLAYLVDSSNYKNFLYQTDCNITAYTSFADLPKITQTENVFYKVLQKADMIYYCPPKIWSDHTDEFTLENQQQITEYFLSLLSDERNNVQGLDLSRYKNNFYLKLQDLRKSADSLQLWVAGCSVTRGVGVDIKEKYSTKIAQFFAGEFSDLSQGGSSIEFSADQILRSNVCQGDIVVWGLTSEYRALVWDRELNASSSVNPYCFDYNITNKADDIVDETRLYKATIAFAQVENFCEKIGAKLIAIPILCSEALQLLLRDHKCYYQLPYLPCFLDLGSDNLHPGSLQHQWYADQISNIFQKISLTGPPKLGVNPWA